MRKSKLKRVLIEALLPLNIAQLVFIKDHTDEQYNKLQAKIDELLQRQGKQPVTQPRDANGRFTKLANDADGGQSTKVVSPYTDENGKIWVHVCAGDIDFLLDIKDLTDKEVDWNTANKLAADAGMRLNPKREFQLIAPFIDEINKCCVDLGGEPLKGWYWTGDEYDGRNAWYFSATNGILGIDSKMISNGVRGSLAYKKS